MESNDTERYGNQMMEYASKYALFLGCMWIMSFVCSMQSLQHPILGHIGNFISLFSLYQLYAILITYRARIENIGFTKCWLLAWTICIFSGLLTSMVQYIYFQFFDNGQLITHMTTLMESDEYKELSKKMFPELDLQEMINMLSLIKVRDIVIQLISFNFFISVPFSFISAFVASRKRIRQKQDIG